VTDSRRTCPVCGFPGLSSAPYGEWPGLPIPEGAHPPYDEQFGGASFEICPSCGFQFGYDDHPGASGSATSFEEYRQRWVATGCEWWFSSRSRQPAGWNGTQQMVDAGLGSPDP